MQYQVKRIGDFCRTGSGSTPSRNQIERYYEGGHIPWVKSGELREDLIASTEEHVTDAALHETSIKLVPAGAILIAMYGATVGRLAILGIEATTNQAVCHIVPAPELADARYLYHAVSAQVPAIIAMGVGGAQPNISQAIIKELKVPLPSLPEQRRIAAILDQADALRAKRREALAELDQLTQSIFVEMFGDPVTNPKGWPINPLGDVLLFIRNGANVEQTDKPTGWPISRIETIWNGSIDSNRVKYIHPNACLSEEYEIEVGDILFSHINSPEHIAKTAIYIGKPSRLIHGINLLRLRCKSDAVNPLWLTQLLKHSSTRAHFRTRCKKAVNQASLNQQDIKTFACITPPLSIQQVFAHRVDAIAAKRPTLESAALEFNSLFSSLQHRAFRGEL